MHEGTDRRERSSLRKGSPVDKQKAAGPAPADGSQSITAEGFLGWTANTDPANRTYPRYVLVAVDAVLWAACIVIAEMIRYGSNLPRSFAGGLAIVVGAAVAVQVALGLLTPLYRSRWRVGSFEEMLALAPIMVVVTAAATAVSLAPAAHLVPVSATIGGGALALLFAAGIRGSWRAHRERGLLARGTAEKTIIFGAGEAGAQLLDGITRDPSSGYLPVALLDDDSAKRKMRLRRLQVCGTRHDLKAVADATGAVSVIIAIPSADAEVVREITDLAIQAGLGVKVLPTVSQMLSLTVQPADIRPVSPADLLGRRVVRTDVASIASYLTAKRVMVTGAGGSIGSELCRQIHRFAPAALIMVDRDESALHQVQLSIEGRALLDRRDLVLCDIRDAAALGDVFDEHRPQVVFHAAALKHLPMLEMWPAEAVKTNVVGTWNLLAAAERTGVERFVNVSTDKAANPTSVLGYSKRIGERLTADTARRAPGTFLSVRFGNVLGSRGSVLKAFEAQLAAGGPLTVTDERVTRYFMMVEEAVELVIQAGAIGRDGEVLVLDMGEPVRIADVARRIAATSRDPVDIVYTGLRPGEKLHEDLFGVGEVAHPASHPMISHVDVPPLPASTVDHVCAAGAMPVDAVRSALMALCHHGVEGHEAGHLGLDHGDQLVLIDLTDGAQQRSAP